MGSGWQRVAGLGNESRTGHSYHLAGSLVLNSRFSQDAKQGMGATVVTREREWLLRYFGDNFATVEGAKKAGESQIDDRKILLKRLGAQKSAALGRPCQATVDGVRGACVCTWTRLHGPGLGWLEMTAYMVFRRRVETERAERQRNLRGGPFSDMQRMAICGSGDQPGMAT